MVVASDTRRDDRKPGVRSLVTGGAGFIGSHLVDALLARGDAVVVIDDMSTGSAGNLEEARRQGGSLTVIEQDVRYVGTRHMQEMVLWTDRIFHLASVVGVRLYVDDPVGTIETIIETTQTMLNALLYKPSVPMLVTSTSEVYGRGAKVPMQEDDDLLYGSTVKSRWSYGMAKGIDEHLALGYARKYGLDVRTVRLFNTVGPRQSGAYGMVLPRFVDQALSGLPITVYGDGTQTRTFTHIDDVVRSLLATMETSSTSNTVMNLGGDEEVSMRYLAHRVKDVTGSTSEIVYVPYAEAYGDGFEDLPRRHPDVTRARERIGFHTTKSLDDMIRDTVEWRRQVS